MPPQYKPLNSGIPGIPAEIFSQAPVDFQDAIKTNEAIRAQQLANSINEISAQKAEQQFANQNQLRDSLKSQFGAQEDGSTPEFDANAALETAKKLAFQQGDLESGLKIVQAQRNLSGDRELTDVEAAQLGVPPGTTLAVARAIQRGQDLSLDRSKFNDPLRVSNRSLDATLKEQKATGTTMRAPNASEASTIGAADAAINFIDNINERYLSEIPENRAIRYGEAKLNPNSAIARYAKDLSVAAKNVALAMELRVTDQDYQIIAEFAAPTGLDTIETLMDKSERLKEYVRNRTRTNLNALGAANVNVTGLKNRKMLDFNGNEIDNQDGSNPPIMIPKAGQQQGEDPAFRSRVEEIKRQRRAQMGGN